MTRKTLEQRIGIFFRDRKETKEDEEKIFEILRNNGCKDRVFEGFSDEVTLFGNPKKYKIEYKFGKPMVEGQYALVPVSFNDSYHGIESASLALVDRANKKVAEIVNAGDRGVHYNGKCKIKPTSMSVENWNKFLIFSYKTILHADNQSPLVVNNSIWRNYLFRHTEYFTGRVNLEKLEERQ